MHELDADRGIGDQPLRLEQVGKLRVAVVARTSTVECGLQPGDVVLAGVQVASAP